MPLYGNTFGAFSPYAMSGGKDPYSLDQFGIPQYMHQQLARNIGYTGEFGAGAHNQWLAADPTRTSAWDRAVSEYKDQDQATNFGQLDWLMGEAAPGISRWQNQAINSYLGYGGGYGAGENNAWLAADPSRQTRYNDITGAFGALGKSPVVSGIGSLMGAFGSAQSAMYPGMGDGYSVPGYGGGTVPGNTYNNYYQSQPVDYGFGAFGGGGYGMGGPGMDYGMGSWGGGQGYGAPMSAGAFTFADGGEVPGYAEGGAFSGPNLPRQWMENTPSMRDWRRQAMQRRVMEIARATGQRPADVWAQLISEGEAQVQDGGRRPPMTPETEIPQVAAMRPQIPDPGSDIPGGQVGLGPQPPMGDTPGGPGGQMYPAPGQGHAGAPAGPAPRPRAPRPRPMPGMSPSGPMPEPQGFGDDPSLPPGAGAFGPAPQAAQERPQLSPQQEMTLLQSLMQMLGMNGETGKPAHGAWQGPPEPQAQQFGRQEMMGAFS